jgi:transposase InsO family protein
MESVAVHMTEAPQGSEAERINQNLGELLQELRVFEWIEAWYNPRRRHSYCKMLSPVDYEAAHAA